MSESRESNPYAPPTRLNHNADSRSPEPSENTGADLQHVLVALNYAILEVQQDDTEQVQVNAQQICRMVLCLACRMTAYDASGSEALAYLREMNLSTSEQVGHAVLMLDQLGLTRPGKDDDPSDFHGLFHLDVPPSRWALPFDLAAEMAFACRLNDESETADQ